MTELSLKARILKYLRNHYPEKINGGDIERLTLSAGYKASNGSRRCREMRSGKLSNGRTCPIVIDGEEKGGSVWYWALPPKEVVQYTNADGKIIVINKW